MNHKILVVLVACVMFFMAPTSAKQSAALAMPDSYSAEVAKQILEEGGNAVDAAIAAQFVLAVTLPEAGNIGGGGFMTIYKDEKSDFLDYREVAPKRAYREMKVVRLYLICLYTEYYHLVCREPLTACGKHTKNMAAKHGKTY